MSPARGKTVSFDERYGWRYVNHAGQWCGCPPPFVTHKQAVDYALARLRANEDSPYSVIIDARAALEWAAGLGAQRTCNEGLQVPTEGLTRGASPASKGAAPAANPQIQTPTGRGRE